MKKITKLLIIALILYSTLLQTINAQTITRVYLVENFNRDRSTSTWLQKDDTHYTYGNEGDKETVRLNIIYSNGIPEDNYRHLKSYNEFNSRIETIEQNKSGNDWINDERNTRTFDNENRLILDLDQIANGTLWDGLKKIEYEYPDENTIISRDYNFINNVEMLQEESTYTISLNSRLEIVKRPDINQNLILSERNETILDNGRISEQLTQLWDTDINDWVNDTWYKVSYNGDETKNKEEVFDWDTSIEPDDWVLSTEITYTYSSSNPKTITLIKDCGNGACEQNLQYLYSYYPDGRLEKIHTQIWDADLGVSGEWYDWSESDYVYETNKETITRKSIDFFNGGVYGLSTKAIRYYEEGIALSIEFQTVASVHPYPNPTSDVINIKFKNGLADTTEATLYDLQGKLIHSETIKSGSTLHTIPITFQANGIYMLHLTSNDSKEVYKIIKQ